MSDEELNIEDVSGGTEEPESGGGKKTGFIPGIVITILKYAAVGLGIIILAVTATVITFNVINKGGSRQPITNVPQEYKSIADPYEYYENLDSIRGTTSGMNPAVFSGKFVIGYTKGDKEINTELIERKNQIQNKILTYLSRKNYDELKPDRYEEIQEQLKGLINGMLKSGKIKEILMVEFTAIR